MSKTVTWILSLLVVFGLALTACNTDTEDEETPPVEATLAAVEEVKSQVALAGTAWELEFMGELEESLPVIEDTRPTVNFMVSRYTGLGSCNWFVGEYAVENEALTLYSPAITNLVCPEPDGIMDQEYTYMSALGNTTEYRMDGEKLQAYTVNDQLMATFVPAQEVPLEGTVWVLKSQTVDDGLAPLIWGSEITAQFEGDQVSGSAGCNSYSASVEIDGNELTIGPATFTERACEDPPGVMEQEMLYLATLQSLASYEKVGGVLALADAEGQPRLLFAAQ